MVAKKESFREVVTKVRTTPCDEVKAIDKWQFRIRTFSC
jgi:hypothetical protein